MKVATKTTEDSIGFFGELCPLSNFHRSQFLYNEVNYHSLEQMIQHMKAKVFGDKVVQKQILDAKTPLPCKHLSKDISNFSFKTWAKKAKDVCKKGLEAKFMQNPRALQALLETGHKKLVECTYDTLWGNGIPLHQPTCLNQHLWKNQGILGELLQEIRQKNLDLAKSLLPSLNPWFHQGPPKHIKYTDLKPEHCSRNHVQSHGQVTSPCISIHSSSRQCYAKLNYHPCRHAGNRIKLDRIRN